jgi:membrane dipeptidase
VTATAPAPDGPVIDGHNDVLLRLWSDEDDPVTAFRDGREGGHLDLPRAREGGLDAGLFAVFAPSEEVTEPTGTDEGYAYPYPDAPDTEHVRRVTYEQLALLHRLAREVDGFRVVADAAGLEACLDGEASGTSRASSGRSSDGGEALGAVPHLEGASAVGPDLSNLDLLHAAGVRSIGLVWSRPNHFGHGVPAEYPGDPDTSPGLTGAGRDLVRACDERGIVIDCAHLNAAGVEDVAAYSSNPLVVSHAGAHAVCPASRNLTDEQLELVGQSDGVVGVTFACGFLRPDGDREADASVETLVDHVVHVADVAGTEHVALGSDFDGATIPSDIGDAAGLPLVLDALSERFSARETRAIAAWNWHRVLRETWT